MAHTYTDGHWTRADGGVLRREAHLEARQGDARCAKMYLSPKGVHHLATQQPQTLGALRNSGFEVLPVREEIRKNLITKLAAREPLFPGIHGYEETVIPQLENAILSGHDVIMLGERGQAKSRIIRALVSLLDEWTPVLGGVEIPENPYRPISEQGRQLVEELGDDAPISWMHRDERYGEKLATPDITIADVIGEVDPIKVAEGRYLSEQLTIHFGLIPRPIRGHKVRLALDVFIVATANPEDYTNRGRIITPLKDRYGSQIRTHYPRTVEDEVGIINQESARIDAPGFNVVVPDYMREIVAEVTRLARRSPDVNQRSGVSVRASVSDYEAMMANALRRAIRLGEKDVSPRITDLSFIRASLEGKVEFETVEDGREDQIIDRLVQGAVVAVFNRRCSISELEPVINVFKAGLSADTGEMMPVSHYQQMLKQVDGLPEAVAQVTEDTNLAAQASAVEFVLE